jgi:bacteriocin-like protein
MKYLTKTELSQISGGAKCSHFPSNLTIIGVLSGKIGGPANSIMINENGVQKIISPADTNYQYYHDLLPCVDMVKPFTNEKFTA